MEKVYIVQYTTEDIFMWMIYKVTNNESYAKELVKALQDNPDVVQAGYETHNLSTHP